MEGSAAKDVDGSSKQLDSDSDSDYVSFASEEDFDEDEEDVYETMDDRPMEIERGLFIGSFLAEQNIEALRKRQITHVLQVGSGLCPSHEGAEFKYLTISIDDHPSEDLVLHFEHCFKFIDDALHANGGVLVHCMAGASRSATVCIGYLMNSHKVDYDHAFKMVHTARPWICPNKGFQEQLLAFHKIGYDLSQWSTVKPKSIGTRRKQTRDPMDFDETDLM